MKVQNTFCPTGGAFQKVIAATAMGLIAALPAFGIQDGPYCQDYPQTMGTWSLVKALPKFNKPGTLTSVTISLSVDVAGSSLAIQNTAPGGVTASSDVKVFLAATVPAPDNVPPLNTLNIMDSAGQFVSMALDGDNGMGSLYAPPDGTTLSVAGTDSKSKTYTAPGDNLAAFVGAGTIPVKVRVLGSSSDVSGGNFLSQFSAFSSARICVVYEYTASPTKPGCGFILSPGYWKNWDNHYTQAQFQTKIANTLHYAALSIAQVTAILNNNGDQYHRHLMSAELNVANNPPFLNAIYHGGSLDGKTVAQILTLAFNTAANAASADLVTAVKYLGSDGENAGPGSCKVTY